MEMTLKQAREKLNMTQVEVANFLACLEDHTKIMRIMKPIGFY